MGSAASVERMDREALAAEAERNRFPAAVCAKIIEKDIDGATALEYADLPEDDMTALAKEFFDSVADRGKVKGALKKLRSSAAGDTSAGAGGAGGGTATVEARRSARLAFGGWRL